MLLTVKLMFEWLGEGELAERLEHAIAKVIKPPLQKDASVEGEVNNLPARVRFETMLTVAASASAFGFCGAVPYRQALAGVP